MTARIEFHVAGRPIPQGSARAFVTKTKPGAKPRAFVTNDDDGTINKWRSDIRDTARHALPPSHELLTSDVRLGVVLWFDRPKSHYLPVTKSRLEPVLRPDAPVFVRGRGDIDKHLRSVMDALSLVVYVDDDQVVAFGRTEKRWATRPGASIEICEIVE